MNPETETSLLKLRGRQLSQWQSLLDQTVLHWGPPIALPNNLAKKIGQKKLKIKNLLTFYKFFLTLFVFLLFDLLLRSACSSTLSSKDNSFRRSAKLRYSCKNLFLFSLHPELRPYRKKPSKYGSSEQKITPASTSQIKEVEAYFDSCANKHFFKDQPANTVPVNATVLTADGSSSQI